MSLEIFAFLLPWGTSDTLANGLPAGAFPAEVLPAVVLAATVLPAVVLLAGALLKIDEAPDLEPDLAPDLEPVAATAPEFVPEAELALELVPDAVPAPAVGVVDVEATPEAPVPPAGVAGAERPRLSSPSVSGAGGVYGGAMLSRLSMPLNGSAALTLLLEPLAELPRATSLLPAVPLLPVAELPAIAGTEGTGCDGFGFVTAAMLPCG